MKKKLITTILIATMVFSVTACGKGASGNNEAKDGSVVTESNESSNTQKESQDTAGKDGVELSEFTYEYVENNFGYRIMILPYYNEELGCGHASYEAINGELDPIHCEIIYITQYSGDVGDDEQKELIDMTQYEDSTDIFDLLIKNIDHELFGATVWSLIDYSVKIVETTEINGLEMTKFEGTITADHRYEEENRTFSVVAYGIKTQDTPVLVMCVDKTKDQSRHEVWVDKIDEMIATFQDGTSAE